MYEIETRTQDEQQVAVIHGSMEPGTVESWLASTHGILAVHLQRVGVPIVGMPFARYHLRPEGGVDVVAGLPVGEMVDHKDEVTPDVLPGGEVAVTWHPGPLAKIAAAYASVEEWLARTGSEAVDAPWEVYHSDPQRDPDRSTWLVEVVQPIRPA